MDDLELQRRMKAHAMSWKETGEILHEERLARLQHLDTVRAVASLSGLFDSAVWLHPPNASSGMVEMQEIFARAPQ